MAVDPTEPETLDEVDEVVDEEEQAAPRQAQVGEFAEADAVEQRRDVLRLRDVPLTERARAEANPADAAEQTRVVDPGDEEYR